MSDCEHVWVERVHWSQEDAPPEYCRKCGIPPDDDSKERSEMSTETRKAWYAANMGTGHQGLVIDEATGANIAVTYDRKDAALVAAAPTLYEALEHLAAYATDGGECVICGLWHEAHEESCPIPQARAALALVDSE